MKALNEYDEALMHAPSVPDREDGLCAVCRAAPATNRHHIVPRSHGGMWGPTVPVCGMGNASGCHGMLHDGRMHLYYTDGEWRYHHCPNGCKLGEALEMRGWRPL